MRTFVETVAASTITSVLRRSTAKKRAKAPDHEPTAESLHLLVRIEFHVDLDRVLGKMDLRDKRVAQLLLENGPAQVATILRISRAAVYRSIERIRTALVEGGYR